MSAVLSEDIIKRIVRHVSPLQENPWCGWAKGTTVTRVVKEYDPKQIEDSSHSDVVYEVMESGKSIHRIQNIKGASKRQEIMVADEEGLTKAKVDGKGVDAAINIDDALIMSVLRKINITTTDYEKIVINKRDQWSLAEFPSIVLRYKTESEFWSIVSLQNIFTIEAYSFPCVVVDIKKQISPTVFIQIRQRLSSEVPGHLLEESQTHVRMDEKTGKSIAQCISHQIVSKLSF